MMRPIKFRAFEAAYKHKLEDRPAVMHYFNLNEYAFDQDGEQGAHHIDLESMPLMQFTGLHDKNGLKELYEGDIIDADGNLKGNIYESPQIYEEGIDYLIDCMGTETWRSTESIAMGRGCQYTK